MNSIKNNPFVSALAGITIVACAVLFYLASQAGARYDDAKASFDDSYSAVGVSENIALYPTAANRDGKSKALGEYRESIAELRGLFDKYRPGPLENVDPQEFTSRLKETNTAVGEAFASAGTELPTGFFLGFEAYSGKLAIKEATGVLGYQLDAISHALRGLAEARPKRVIAIYREPAPEETNGTYEPKPDDVARNFACEVTFEGSEASARKFLSYLGATEKYYHVIRCVKVTNERDTPPTVDDAKFETPAPAAAASTATDIFKDVFVLPGDEAEPEATPPAPDGAVLPPVEGEEPPPAPAAEVDTTRILAQVLGSENVTVFVRFDTSMFLPAKDLPNP